MTDAMMSLRTLVEKSPDADLLREMIEFAAERLMELKVGALTGAGYGEKSAGAWRSAMATATVTGRPGPARSSCGSRSCGPALTSRASWSRSGWPRRR